MDAASPPDTAIAHRLARLESQVRTLRAALGVGIVAAVALGARPQPPSVVTADRLVLRGERGRGRAEFAVVGSTRLRITMTDFRHMMPSRGDSIPADIRGSAQLELVASPPELRLSDEEGNPVLRLGPLARPLR